MKASGLIAGGALVALLLAGCGGDNSASVSSATTSGGSATTAGASSATKSGDNSSTTTASSTARSDDASTTTPSFKGNANSEFCTYVKQIANSDLASNLGEDPSKLKDDLQQVGQVLDNAVSKAPAEIKDDLTTVASGIKQYRDFLAQYDYDMAKLTAAAQKDPTVIQKVTDTLSDPKFEQASTRIEAYGQQVCGLSTSTTS
jgi:hypothetical protein